MCSARRPTSARLGLWELYHGHTSSSDWTIHRSAARAETAGSRRRRVVSRPFPDGWVKGGSVVVGLSPGPGSLRSHGLDDALEVIDRVELDDNLAFPLAHLDLHLGLEHIREPVR